MSAITIRRLSEEAHNALRRLARLQNKSVEAVAREALEEKARETEAIPRLDMEQIQRVRSAHGLTEEGPDWPAEFDDAPYSRKVLGLED